MSFLVLVLVAVVLPGVVFGQVEPPGMLDSGTWTCDGTDCTFVFEPGTAQTSPLMRFAGIGSGYDLEFRPSGSVDYYVELLGAGARLRIDSGDRILFQSATASVESGGRFGQANNGNCSAGGPNLYLFGDSDTGFAVTTGSTILCAGSIKMVEAVDAAVDYVSVLGCRDYGPRATAPTPNGACDRYYDTTGAGAFCVYNGSTWDKIGSGTCA